MWATWAALFVVTAVAVEKSSAQQGASFIPGFGIPDVRNGNNYLSNPDAYGCAPACPRTSLTGPDNPFLDSLAEVANAFNRPPYVTGRPVGQQDLPATLPPVRTAAPAPADAGLPLLPGPRATPAPNVPVPITPPELPAEAATTAGPLPSANPFRRLSTKANPELASEVSNELDRLTNNFPTRPRLGPQTPPPLPQEASAVTPSTGLSAGAAANAGIPLGRPVLPRHRERLGDILAASARRQRR